MTPSAAILPRDRSAAIRSSARRTSVAEELAIVSQAGVRGIGISFVNYLNEVPYFCDEVLPRLERAGVRAKR